jgi:myo-inositol-1-phosphate synthase
MLAVGEDGDLLNLGEKKKKKKKKQTSEVVVNMITYSKLASSHPRQAREC